MLPRTPQKVTENSPDIPPKRSESRTAGKHLAFTSYELQTGGKAGRLRVMNRERTDWGGVVFGFSLACLIAFQQFKLPPVMPAMLAEYGWDRTLAGAFMAVYALAGLLFSIPIGRFLQRGDVFRLLIAALTLMLLGDLMTLVRPQS